jgi:hypothetical protein
MTARIASAETRPSVPGVHARAKAIKGNGCGATTLAVNASLVQPRPNGNVSSRTLDSPHSVRRPFAQAAAARMFGEFVRRGPCTSVRCQAVSITCERRSPSSLMR